MQEKIIVFKFNDDGSEERIGGLFNNDQEAIGAITEPGNYIFYRVLSVEVKDLKKADNE